MGPKPPAWRYSLSDEGELLYLSLFAKHQCGEQQHPTDLDSAYESDESGDEDDGVATDRQSAVHSTTTRSGPLEADRGRENDFKDHFLDCFAELLAYRKDPGYVSGSVLVECEKKIKLFVARNAGFDIEDRCDSDFFERLKRSIQDKQAALYGLLVEYYRPRLLYHLKKLIAAVKGSKGKAAVNDNGLGACALRFISLCLETTDAIKQRLSVQVLGAFATKAYELTRSEEINLALRQVVGQGATDRVFRQLRFVARIKAIYQSILECVKLWPQFSKVEIHPLPLQNAVEATRASLADAREATLATVRENLAELPACLLDSRTEEKVNAEFYKRRTVVHAEMQLVCFFESNKEYSPYSYMGVSKKTCYLCALSLASMSTWKTRPSHDRLHPFWTLPIGFEVRKHRMRSPIMAFKEVKQKLAEMIGRPEAPKLLLRPESTAAWSARIAISSAAVSAASSRLPVSGGQASRMPEKLAPTQTKGLTSTGRAAHTDMHATFDYGLPTLKADYDLMVVQLAYITKLLEEHFGELALVIQEAVPILRLNQGIRSLALKRAFGSRSGP